MKTINFIMVKSAFFLNDTLPTTEDPHTLAVKKIIKLCVVGVGGGGGLQYGHPA